jgi:TPR repeat protein
MQHNNKRILLLSFMAVFLLVLAGCSTTPDEDRLESPEMILQEAHRAYAMQDYQKVFQLVFPLAASGDADAQYTLGYLYFHGLGVVKSEIQAMNWIQRAATQGHKKALQALK